MKRISSMLAVAASVAVFAPTQATAQVSSTDGAAFIGGWHLPLDAMGQAVNLMITIEDSEGMLDVEISREGGETEVEDISLRDGTLVLEYDVDLQGQMAPIELRLTPAGENLAAKMDIADGMLELDGTAMKH